MCALSHRAGFASLVSAKKGSTFVDESAGTPGCLALDLRAFARHECPTRWTKNQNNPIDGPGNSAAFPLDPGYICLQARVEQIKRRLRNRQDQKCSRAVNESASARTTTVPRGASSRPTYIRKKILRILQKKRHPRTLTSGASPTSCRPEGKASGTCNISRKRWKQWRARSTVRKRLGEKVTQYTVRATQKQHRDRHSPPQG